jgi:hypothetical protein
MVLASNRSIETIVRAPATVSIGSRLTASFTLEPMSVDETCEYLLAKLRAGGCSEPQSIIPLDVCYRIHESAEGWPGVVDTLVLLAIARATECPIAADHIERLVLPDIRSLEVPEADEVSTETSAEEAPRLILTLNGQTLKDIALDETRLLIGRAEHNDLSIGSRYISRHHTLLVRHGRSTFLMDLNSTNGTYVNSRRVSNHILQHDDIISLGQHNLKFVDPLAVDSPEIYGPGFAETVIMKSLQDIRRLLARENTVALPARTRDAAESESNSA